VVARAGIEPATHGFSSLNPHAPQPAAVCASPNYPENSGQQSGQQGLNDAGFSNRIQSNEHPGPDAINEEEPESTNIHSGIPSALSTEFTFHGVSVASRPPDPPLPSHPITPTSSPLESNLMLLEIAQLWPTIPNSVKHGILAMARAMTGAVKLD